MTYLDAVISKNTQARQFLDSLINGQFNFEVKRDDSLPEISLSNPDVILTPNEVNFRHGTGVIVRNMFENAGNIFSIRFHNYYDGEQDFGTQNLCLCLDHSSRSETFAKLAQLFQESIPKRILCVVFSAQEAMAAIALKEIFNVPLCTYIMDDNNLYTANENTIPYALMEELLQKSSLRLAISPELRLAYERQYGQKFWLLPPVIATSLITEKVTPLEIAKNNPKRGILVGNIWGQQYLDYLRETVRGSGISVDWYCNNYYNPGWLTIDKDELAKDGIFMYPPLAEHELSDVLKKYKFAVVPSGKLDSNDQVQNIARLSLPTRVIFILTTSNTPMLVLGSDSSAAARFINRFQIGLVSDYEQTAFIEAVTTLENAEKQTELRKNAVAIAKIFSSEKIDQWVWESLEKGEATDSRFEDLMPLLPDDFAYYVEPPAPPEIWRDFVPVYQSLKRLKQRGFNPDFVIDVGASTGIWSDTVCQVFDNARFILIDPLISKYDAGAIAHYIKRHKNFEIVESMVSNQSGQGTIQVTEDLYNSSLYGVANAKIVETVTSEIITLDQLREQKALTGCGLLKLDVQFAEHLALEGGSQLLTMIDVCIMELSLWKTNEDTKSLMEMVEIMAHLGFRYYDEVGYWRMPKTGTLFQKDIVFVRNNLYLEEGQLL